MQYSKHKDAAPVDTIEKIRSILSKIDVNTDLIWIDSGVQDVYSNHISVSNTSFGTNGKGTSREYALASGYAELIERIQSGIIKTSIRYNNIENQVGFVYCPDEVFRTTDDLIAQNDAFTSFYFNFFHLETKKEKSIFLNNFPKMEVTSPGIFRCVPFADSFSERIVFIPADLLFPIYGSNGMAAGNTPEEALVQAISEIIERYANKAVLNGIIPPEIPREFWESSGISNIIYEIESTGRYKVSIRDCSLGKGFPVTAVVISDVQKGTFGVHFGCHPSFEVSVERCLTEAMQGKNLESAASLNEIGDVRMCSSIDNEPNLMKIGYGAYPISFFYDKPSYTFSAGKKWSGHTNSEMLKYLFSTIKREGFEILIRDASHLGFPTYQVIIPGMSEIFFSNGQRIKELRTLDRVIASMKNFPDFSLEEENRLLLYMKYKQYSVVENSFGWISNLPLKGESYSTERIRAFLHYKRREYFEACQWFRTASEMMKSDEEKYFLLCASEYAWIMSICKDSEKALCVVKNYFHPDTANKVHESLAVPSEVMKKMFNPFPCYDCENCPHNCIDCEYLNNERVYLKIQTAISKSTINQKNTLRFLKTHGLD